MSLLVPKHYRRTEAAQPVPKPRRADSDDFVSRSAVRDQLAQLQDLITSEREQFPDYQLPKPIGWRLQVLVLTHPEQSDGGVILVDEERDRRALASPQGVVINMGASAYSDPARFTVDGELNPWCRVGDRIQFVKYDAPLYMLGNGQRLGILTDTQPIAVIDIGWKTPK